VFVLIDCLTVKN